MSCYAKYSFTQPAIVTGTGSTETTEQLLTNDIASILVSVQVYNFGTSMEFKIDISAIEHDPNVL